MGHRTQGCCMGIRNIRADIHERFAAIAQRATAHAEQVMDDEDAGCYRRAVSDVHATLTDHGDWWYQRPGRESWTT